MKGYQGLVIRALSSGEGLHMNIEQLEEVLQVKGRYQIYSDGSGEYQAMPVFESAVLITLPSNEQMSAPPDSLIYNPKQD